MNTSISKIDDKIYLNDIWCLYFHDPYDINWDISSYKNIGTISSVDEFIFYFKSFKEQFNNGMFFIMREHIMPRWEDENNKQGGCFSYKIPANDLDDKWFNICTSILGETLGKNDTISNNINGISISPKKFSYIIRIWIKENKYAKKELYNIKIPKYTNIMYKNHLE
jgi:translation initiation factor 4E